MDLENDKKRKIMSIVNVFETGSAIGNYGNVSMWSDGPRNAKQVTYGRSQTTEYGELKSLIKLYIDNNGVYADQFVPYLDKIGPGGLHSDTSFINLLKKAAKDPIMVSTQDSFFDTHYWKPAEKFFIANGFKTPLAMLVIYDSYIHSGSIPSWLRNRFAASPPAAGGHEKDWITEYVSARHQWLATHKSRPILRKTTYRTKTFMNEVIKDNWQLNGEINANGTIVK